jgi:hypothetical protein
MSVKLRITIAILTTLIIGIGIGALFHRAVIQRKINQVLALRNPMHLAEIYQRQWASQTGNSAQIQDILNRHARIVAEIRDHFSEEMTSANESMWEELEPLLSESQKSQMGRRFYGPKNFPARGRRSLDPSIGTEVIEQRLSWLQKELNLSTVQAEGIRKILEQSRIPMMEEFTQVERNFFKMRNRIDQMIVQIDSDIENILNEEQRTRYQQINREPWIPQRPKTQFGRPQSQRRRRNPPGSSRR